MPRLPPPGHHRAPQMVIRDEVPVSDKGEGAARGEDEAEAVVVEVQVNININSVLMHKLDEDEAICHQ